MTVQTFAETRRLTIRDIVKAVGLGSALACIVCMLGFLITIYLCGGIVVGEENKIILICEIILAGMGLIYFSNLILKDLNRKMKVKIT